MKKVDIARALRDKEYFDTLPADEQALVLEASPVGAIQLDDAVLASASGGLTRGVVTMVTGTGTSSTSPSIGTSSTVRISDQTCNCSC